MALRIAFDLDDTIITPNNEFASEKFPPSALIQILGFEPLRLHTRWLLQQLKKQGFETWVYTSSFRNTWYIRRLFWLHGIRLDGIVNGMIHKKRMKNVSKTLSKYPPAFGIDVLIDDSMGVWEEGQKNNFEVILISPNDDNWHLTVNALLSKR